MQQVSNSAAPVAWVTGASSGIGRALCLRLAAAGYRVAASARNGEALSRLEAEGSGRVEAFPLDVTNRHKVAAVHRAVTEVLGPISLAVFSAGLYERDRPSRFDSGILRLMVEVNLMGVAHGIEAVVPTMLARGHGQIAVIASVAGYNGLPGAAFYGATKAALINMCEGIYPELKAKGLDLRVINPGFVATPMTEGGRFPMPFVISAEAAAEKIVQGLAGNRYEIVFPWQMALAVRCLHALPQALRFAITRRMLRHR